MADAPAQNQHGAGAFEDDSAGNFMPIAFREDLDREYSVECLHNFSWLWAPILELRDDNNRVIGQRGVRPRRGVRVLEDSWVLVEWSDDPHTGEVFSWEWIPAAFLCQRPIRNYTMCDVARARSSRHTSLPSYARGNRGCNCPRRPPGIPDEAAPPAAQTDSTLSDIPFEHVSAHDHSV